MEAALGGQLFEDLLLVGVGALWDSSTPLARRQNSDMAVNLPSEGLAEAATTS
jgi:hypothetical protein